MNTIVCPKCGNSNAAQMRFCSNCGQGLVVPNAPTQREEPPPTVFMGQAPPKPQSPPVPPPIPSPFGQQPPPPQQSAQNNPFGQQTPPSNNPFGQQGGQNNPFGQQNSPQTPNQPPAQSNSPQFSTPAAPPQPPKKSNKGLIFGAVGCLGLLLLGGIGAIIAGFFIYGSGSSRTSNYPSPTPYASNSFTSNSSSSNTASNTNSIDTDTPSTTLLTAILESRKAIGTFNQTSVKSVVVKDYFPEGTGAAQASYSNGSKNVFLTVGQFTSMDDSKKNFNDQLRGVKGNGGKVTYQNTASDGTVSAIYEKGGYFFAEYCNTNNYCNRIHSDNRAALQSFVSSYAETK